MNSISIPVRRRKRQYLNIYGYFITANGSMFDMFHAWQEQAEKLKSGEITKEEYDQWRYNYPKTAK